MLNVQNENRLWKLPKKNDIMTKKKNLKKSLPGLGCEPMLSTLTLRKGYWIKKKKWHSANGPTELLTQCENLAIFFSFKTTQNLDLRTGNHRRLIRFSGKKLNYDVVRKKISVQKSKELFNDMHNQHFYSQLWFIIHFYASLVYRNCIMNLHVKYAGI